MERQLQALDNAAAFVHVAIGEVVVDVLHGTQYVLVLHIVTDWWGFEEHSEQHEHPGPSALAPRSRPWSYTVWTVAVAVTVGHGASPLLLCP